VDRLGVARWPRPIGGALIDRSMAMLMRVSSWVARYDNGVNETDQRIEINECPRERERDVVCGCTCELQLINALVL
jgi:hypothetical protein